MTYAFHPAARRDYRRTLTYYADISPDLPNAFMGAVEKAIGDVCRFPLAWPIVEGEVRRHSVERFPYCLYYVVNSDTVQIFAILHARRHPDAWRGRPPYSQQ